MKALSTMSACLILMASSAFAMDDMKKPEGMAKPGMKKDDAMMKKDTMCADMMKKDDGMMKPSSGMASQPK